MLNSLIFELEDGREVIVTNYFDELVITSIEEDKRTTYLQIPICNAKKILDVLPFLIDQMEQNHQKLKERKR